VSHEGEAHRAEPGVMTFGEPAKGEIYADRYQLEEHVDTDRAGRLIWRGLDVVLRRPVAVVIRQPGGEAAAAMLTSAVAASRLVHPHIVSVYDAIDDGVRAYLVREWVAGVALRDVLVQSPLDAERSTLVTHAIAEAVAALHSAGIAHGNVHPGTILIADDGRVVLTDAHADGLPDPESDIRAIGAVLYSCLTSHWPYAEAGRSTLPDAVRDSTGQLATPRQVLGGIPGHLDEIAADLLDLQNTPPSAAVVASEFARLATQGSSEQDYDPQYDPQYDYDDDPDRGPMGFVGSNGGGRRRAGGKLALGVAVLTAIAIAGAFIGAKVLGSSSGTNADIPGGVASATAPASQGGEVPIAITPQQLRLVDPPKGDRAEFKQLNKAVDGNENTGAETAEYKSANFGGLKPGMGILINLGAPTKVKAVKVTVNLQGASVGLRTGTSDPGADSAGDQAIATGYTPIGSALEDQRTVMVFAVGQEVQYLLVWITKLPMDPAKGKYKLSVNEISVLAP
jgi:eukaryotic-like serine/threonine-protein kinase